MIWEQDLLMTANLLGIQTKKDSVSVNLQSNQQVKSFTMVNFKCIGQLADWPFVQKNAKYHLNILSENGNSPKVYSCIQLI